ncbi:hypothetical protein CfE428DRAFT_0453 [Chthoniobacter flavus Ellin428]|uniref:Uncharacterized protein n=1 Tax=Chthoniobacter flavus Ellin428 TaxID=497964 RepID=B4CUU0_9BACT|nr:hypothetical protein CfE428DRAFT_0453 [Chthoniobacter flavus Ellin428]
MNQKMERHPKDESSQPPENRRDRRREAEDDGDVGHDALRFRAHEKVAHDGASDNATCAGGRALEKAKEDEHAEAGRESRANRAQYVKQHGGEQHGTAPEGVGQRAVEERHDGERSEIDGEGLLRGGRGHREDARDGEQRRQIGIDGKRAQHGEGGEHENKQAIVHGKLGKLGGGRGRVDALEQSGCGILPLGV